MILLSYYGNMFPSFFRPTSGQRTYVKGKISAYYVLKHNGTSSIKITSDSQARSINVHKNLRNKVMKWCANIYFNQQYIVRTDFTFYLCTLAWR